MRSNPAITGRDDEALDPAVATPPTWRREGVVAVPHVAVACRTSALQLHNGDLCVAYPIGDALLVVIGDATGHGYDAALVAALARGACEVAAAALRPLSAPRLLELIDQTLCAASRGGVLMSCAVAIVGSRTMSVASAGHPLPYVIRRDGDCEGVRAFGAVLGSGIGGHQATTVALRPGDRVCWYTDGVLDTEDEHGGRFGHRHLRNVLRRSRALGADELATELAAELFWFRGDAAAVDDASFAIAEIW